jgi:F-type H+-transporting ATPase subunit b
MEALGIDGRLLLAQVLNFGVLLFVLNKILYKPLIKMLDDRKSKIEEALANNQKIEEKLSEITEKEKTILKKAQKKAEEESEKLMELAQEEKKKIIEEARAQADKESQKGIEKIKVAEAEAQKRLKAQFADAVVKEVTQKLYKQNSKENYPMLEEILK